MVADLREIARFCALESRRAQLSDDDLVELERLRRSYEVKGSDARRFSRGDCALRGRLAHGGDTDSVSVLNIAPGGALIEGAFFLGPGDRVDLYIDDDGQAVHFLASVVWVTKRRAGLELTGVPSSLEPYWRTGG
ncbi:MAG: PilZ domain-containing protein [Deltaproteobacteria bacterium]|nr:PilZ domain-containing protein [Deltaproteobacteria bacterium]